MLRMLICAAIFASAAPAAEIGRIKSATGAASIARAGASVAAKPGVVLAKGDVLVTGRDGRIGVTFIDNSRFAVGPNSRIALAEFDFDTTTHKGRFLTRVERGSVAVNSGQIAKENRDQMRVATPTSLLAVRGTRFVVEVK